MTPDRRSSTQGTALLVANYAPDVGFAWWLMEEFWIELARLARAAGLEPLIAYPLPGNIPDRIKAEQIPWETTVFSVAGVKNALACCAVIRRHRVRVIYFTDRQFSSVWFALFRLLGVRLIINHDHTPGDRPPVHGLRGFLKAVWRRLPWLSADAQFCVSELIRDRAIGNARIPEHRLRVVQNGIRPIRCDGTNGYVHRALGLGESDIVCITVGRADAYKRIDFIIEVAAKCINDHQLKDLKFVHCGDGPDAARLEALIRASNLEGRFILAGKRSDVPSLLCSSSIAIHAARGEAFSLAVLEYMSAGLPVVVPDIPTVCQAVVTGETGFVFHRDDVAEAAAYVSQLYGDAALRRQLGGKAAERVRTHYSYDSMMAALRTHSADLLAAVSA